MDTSTYWPWPVARGPRAPQRRHGAKGAEQAGDGVRRAAADLGRVVRVGAGHAHPAPHGLGHDVEGRPVHVGALAAAPVAEAADRGVDQARIDGRQGLIAQAHPVHHAGAEVLHHRVGAGDQLAQQLPALGLLQVDDDAALVAVAGGEEAAVLVLGVVGAVRAALAEEVAAGRLDLDHLGAMIGQQLGAERAGHGVAQVDNP